MSDAEHAAVESILNHIQVAPDIATSGQPTPAQLEAIATAGYDVVINLAVPTSDNAVADEATIVAGLGLTYVNIPVDFAEPTIDDLRRFLGVMRAYDDATVWVHCALNYRVSAFVYHYLRHVRGLDEATSRTSILDDWRPDGVWGWLVGLSPAEIGPSADPLTRSEG